MKKWIIAAFAALAAQSCFTIILDEDAGPVTEMPDYLRPTGDITVVTGLAYPEDVDWNVSGLENSRARVVMYMDRELKINLSVEASEGKACCDPYQHLYCAGHLYSVFLSDDGTVLVRDGTPILQLEGRKFIAAVRDDGEKLRTLWENEGGKGLVSVHGNEILYSNPDGSLFRNIGVDESGDICFFYSVQVKSSSGLLTQYYCVIGKDAIQMDLPKDLNEIFGFTRTPEGFNVLCRNQKSRAYEVYDTSTGVSKLLFPSGNGYLTALSNDLPALFHACITHPVRNTEWNVIMLDDTHAAEWETDDLPTGFARTGKTVGGVRKSRLPQGRDILVRGNVCDTLPAGYSVMTDGAVYISPSGSAKIGLSSKTGGRALLWTDGKIDSLGFRGVVTGVYVQSREPDEEEETIRTTRPTEGRNHIFTPN